MHTKEPWIAEWDEFGGYDCMWGAYIIKEMDGKEIAVLEDVDHKMSVDTYNDKYTPPQALTDKAHLIAAAPELLETLDGALQFIELMGMKVPEDFKRVIAKANGLST